GPVSVRRPALLTYVRFCKKMQYSAPRTDSGTTGTKQPSGGNHAMLAKQRQARILAEIQEHGWARVTDLTALLGVSDMTVRRDLDQLAASGSVHKVHGGAVLNNTT